MKITLPILSTLFHTTHKSVLAEVVDPLNAALEKFDISTVARAAAFLAQTGHESGGYSVMVENLNYSAEGLQKVFHKYFPTHALANAYAHQPQKIASRVYASRMGNGPESSGEGYHYRGRGYLQITGKSQYQAFADAMDISLEDAVAYLETVQGASMSAAWWWHEHGLNALADQGAFQKITLRVNGGLNGEADRLALYTKAKKLLSA